PMNMDNATDKMLYFGVSEYLFNTAGFAYHSAGALNYLITNNLASFLIPKKSPFQLNTSSIGKLIPEVQKQYPNMLMEVRVLSNAPPAVIIQPKKTILSGYADILTFAILPNGSRAFLFLNHLRYFRLSTPFFNLLPVHSEFQYQYINIFPDPTPHPHLMYKNQFVSVLQAPSIL
uniref:Bactericidal permeability-increasing protein n=1 Tax=Eptatretus burgeri TaxID=7764 RepID=A0A8C4WTI7_EPTBU